MNAFASLSDCYAPSVWRRRPGLRLRAGPRASVPPNPPVDAKVPSHPFADPACRSSTVVEQRRRPESNRCTRLCRPLRSHSATAPEEAATSVAGRLGRSQVSAACRFTRRHVPHARLRPAGRPPARPSSTSASTTRRSTGSCSRTTRAGCGRWWTDTRCWTPPAGCCCTSPTSARVYYAAARRLRSGRAGRHRPSHALPVQGRCVLLVAEGGERELENAVWHYPEPLPRRHGWRAMPRCTGARPTCGCRRTSRSAGTCATPTTGST